MSRARRSPPFLPLLPLLLLAAGRCPARDLAPFVLPWDDAAPPSLAPAPDGGTAPDGALGPVIVRDGHLAVGERRLRLFGFNLTAGACFPPVDRADAIAARMAKFGVNAVRFHFLDSTWGDPRLIPDGTDAPLALDPAALDRLDRFVHALERRGIYLNLNLLVGRRFGPRDGVDPSIAALDWKTAHAIGFFHAPHLAAQKEYARRLLTHRNPYTGRAYASDPALAIVEINNENGLIHQWFGRELDALPAPFAEDLRRQWNDWLTSRHGTTARLAEAWRARDEPPGPEMLANGDFARGTEGWAIERHGRARVDASVADGAIRLSVLEPGDEDWHVQLNQPGLKIVAGRLYTVRFRAAADSPRRIGASLMQAHEPWRQLAAFGDLALAPEWREFSFTFLAAESDANARFGFHDLNRKGAAFRFDDISLRPGGRLGLREGESLERRAIRAPVAAGSTAMSAETRTDWIRFLRETEGRHWREMRRFLREDLGVRAPIVGTIVGNSTPNLMAEMDVVDTHAYWQHPRFPRRQWDPGDWIVENKSMVDHPASATVTRLALCRVAGKPHMVSEYNHPAPNPHAPEGPLFLAAFAAIQDWDALFLYTYAHREEGIISDSIPGFFDIGAHPAIWVNVPAAANLFLRADLAPAPGPLRVPFDPEREIAHIAAEGRHWNVAAVDRLGLDPLLAVSRRLALDLAPRDGCIPAPIATVDPSRPGPADGPISWEIDRDGKGLLIAKSRRSKIVIGKADNREIDLGDGVRVSVGTTIQRWCTLAFTALEGEFPTPRRALLVATGFSQNTAMGWKNPEKTSVGRDWGRGPVLLEIVPASVTVAQPDPGAPPQVRALDARAQPAAPVTLTPAPPGRARFQIGPPHGAPWYEIRYSN